MFLLHKLKQHFDKQQGVLHATLNPGGADAVRIFLVPPKWRLLKSTPSVLIINGEYIIPIGYSWAILLGFFINEINTYKGVAFKKEDYDKIINMATLKCKKIYMFTKLTELKSDLRQVLSAILDVASGKTPEYQIGQIPLKKYAPEMTAPHRMDLLISSMKKDNRWNCNQMCLHCYAAGQEISQTEELSTEQWKLIIDKYKKAGIPQLTFTGGEPTIRDDLSELVEYAKWFITRLNTNGVMLSKMLCDDLRKASLDSIQITIYSSEALIHNELVGANNFEKTILGLKNALISGLNVSVNTPLCKKNRDYTETLKFLKTQGVRYVSCSGLILTGNAKEKTSEQTRLSSDELYEILKDATKFCNENDIDINFTSPGSMSTEKFMELGLSIPVCGAALSNMATAPDGSVVPCQSWLTGKPLGNALTDKWENIWRNTECIRLRNMSEQESLLCPLREQKINKAEGI